MRLATHREAKGERVSFRETLESMASAAQIKVESVAPAASYVTNGVVFTWGAVTLNQILMIIGTLFAVATYFTSLYFQRRRDRREQEFHEYRLWAQSKIDEHDRYDSRK